MVRPQAKEGILRVKPYVGSEAHKGKILSEGRKLINISSNESAFDASPAAKEAFMGSAGDLIRYPEIDAMSLRMALASHHGINLENVICGAGSDQIIDLLALAYAGIGDEVVYSAHGFQMYPIAAHAVGATPVAAPELNLTADVDLLLEKVTDKTKILFLANPNNPTGSYVSQSEIKRLHAGLPGNVILVIDAAYAEYVTAEDYDSGIELVRNENNVVMTRTFSKIYGLASLRVGWAYGPKEIIETLDRIRPPFNVNSIGISGAIAALADKEHTKKSKLHNSEILHWFTEEVKRMGLKSHPSFANFLIVYFDPNTPKNAEAAYQFLFERGIITRRVGGYGLPDWVRISMGTQEEMEIVSATLKEFVEKND
ncbi:MAG: Histidinol-phosphate aminotransferase [Alphaproteobacteria bacterium MarineAlpha12_Bin1]|nr:MAG: Histidinol-phosphate aminotransferase [Alphaproteobacteria bacterium MarineAlpha12_Bin1]